MAADRHQEFDSVFVALTRLPVNDPLGAREQFTHSKRFAGRRRVREQERVQVIDGFGTGKLAQCEVALRVGRARLFVSPMTLLCR